MKEEFNLSDKRDNFLDMNIDKHIYYEKDVKEFIKKLKETIEDKTNNSYSGIDGYSLLEFIDKLAGDKLI